MNTYITEAKIIRSIGFTQSIKTSQDAYNALKEYGLSFMTEECNVILLFDGQMECIGLCEVARGAIEYCDISLRELYKKAIALNAKNIIVAHNHLTDGVCPSNEDIELTKYIMLIGNMLRINLIDHIIVGFDGEWTSMKDSEYLAGISNGEFDDIIHKEA